MIQRYRYRDRWTQKKVRAYVGSLATILVCTNEWREGGQVDGRRAAVHEEDSITSETLLWILCSCGSNDIQAVSGICWTRVSLDQDTEQQCFKVYRQVIKVGL